MASLNYGTHGATSFYPSLPLATVASPDLRGYGDTDAPPSAASYTVLHIVGDLVGLIDHLGIDQVFLVGHDWGAMVAWNFCLFRPDRIKALVNMSVVWFPRNPALNPVEVSRASLGDDYYICRFQVARSVKHRKASDGVAKESNHEESSSEDDSDDDFAVDWRAQHL
ncbi:epoxide hydrolase 3-like [Castanea sativa]|uniref:epoxide hydrolase 3-like n=1 Tax=Castanea sativa TaxID=21020 RepID=UPI003F64BE09